ncbi:MAG: hypothetical protein OXF11_20995 [Deltaproteobacteria bacterium]|nr:hypothetical protein [Deltaproteobacteria bacterium]
MRRFLSIGFVAGFLAATPHFAGAHGGGLNRDGCHRETATGGYHCHPGNSKSSGRDVNWETIGIVVGEILVLGTILLPFTKRDDAPVFDETLKRGLRLMPARGDQVGAFPEVRW